jgi:hypothetical protein
MAYSSGRRQNTNRAIKITDSEAWTTPVKAAARVQIITAFFRSPGERSKSNRQGFLHDCPGFFLFPVQLHSGPSIEWVCVEENGEQA